MTQRDVSDAVKGALKVIQQALKEGHKVTFSGFGTFYTTHRQAGKVRYIRTGQQVSYPARRIAAFRVGDVLKKVRGNK
jgi:DNA-binding protein HU-beta